MLSPSPSISKPEFNVSFTARGIQKWQELNLRILFFTPEQQKKKSPQPLKLY